MRRFLPLTDENYDQIEAGLADGSLVPWRSDGVREWYTTPDVIRGVAREPKIQGMNDEAEVDLTECQFLDEYGEVIGSAPIPQIHGPSEGVVDFYVD